MYNIGQQLGQRIVYKSNTRTSTKGINTKAVVRTVLEILHET
jgi:hypothetical protein